jgi:hypothetical protein
MQEDGLGTELRRTPKSWIPQTAYDAEMGIRAAIHGVAAIRDNLNG